MLDLSRQMSSVLCYIFRDSNGFETVPATSQIRRTNAQAALTLPQ